MRFYLDVPYSRKEEAKQEGCRWDPIKKKWYVKVDPFDVAVFNSDNDLQSLLRAAQRKVPLKFRVVDGAWNGNNEYTAPAWNHLLDVMKEM